MKRWLILLAILSSWWGLAMAGPTERVTIPLPVADYTVGQVMVYTYWFDQDYGTHQTGTLVSGVNQIDITSLSEGYHTLHLRLSSDSTSSLRSYLFYRPFAADTTTGQPLVYTCWFDQDYGNHQSFSLANDSNLIDITSLSEGYHTLHLRLSSDSTSSLRSYLFYRPFAPDTTTGQPLVYTYWFDQDYGTHQTGSLANGINSIVVDSLSEGYHTLHLRLGAGTKSSLRSYLFFRPFAADTVSVDTAQSTLVYWFEGDTAAVSVTPGIGHHAIQPPAMPCDSEGYVYTCVKMGGRNISPVERHAFVTTVDYANAGIVTVNACENYTWHDSTYTASTDSAYFITHNTTGCDSITYLHLTIGHNSTGDTLAVVCDGFTWWNTTFASSTETTHVYTNADGCDSVVTLHLTVNHSSRVDESVTACDEYTWHGIRYTASATPTFSTTNSVGCDSVVTLNLTVNYSNTGVEAVTACDRYVWHGTTYAASTNEPVFTETNAAGCDSVVTLNLTVNYSNTGVEAVTACNHYLWHGTEYYASTNMPTYTTQNAAGCDSVTTLHLTIIECSTTEITACDRYTWHGNVYTTSDMYIDGTDTLLLTINYSNTGVETVTACDSYTWHGTTYYASNNTATYTETNAAGCDSVVLLDLTINYSNTGVEMVTACDNYTWHGNTYYASNNTATFTEVNAAGCDSVVTLILTINYSTSQTDAVTVCDSFSWYGSTYYASSVDTVTLSTINGCDSTLFLILTVNYSSINVDTVYAVDSFFWHGTMYYSSTTAFDTLSSTTGCDSILALALTLTYATVDTVTACDSFYWHGYSFYSSTVFSDTLQDVLGDDSICTLVLTLNHSIHDTLVVTSLGIYTWNDSSYSSPGVYQWIGQTPEGCNHYVTLFLDFDTVSVVYHSVAVIVANTENVINVGGTVSGVGSYLAGSEVTLTAKADEGYTFKGWYVRTAQGFDGLLVTTDRSYTFTLDHDEVLVALFDRIAWLTVLVDDDMGSVHFNGYSTPFNAFRGYLGDTVIVEAIPNRTSRQFIGWVNVLGDTISRDATMVYTLDRNADTLTAVFVKNGGIDDLSHDVSWSLSLAGQRLVVRGATHQDVCVFDLLGRIIGHAPIAMDEVSFLLPHTGIYLVKVGDSPARRIVVRF